MTRRRPGVAAVLAAAAVAAGCAGSTGGDPLAERPYLVAVDPLDEVPSGTITGTLIVDRDCVLLEDASGSLLPLFSEDTRFGPLDGGAVTVDVGATRVRIGDEVTFEGDVGEVTEGLRSRYPGVDLTRCGPRRYALLGDVIG